MKKYKYKAVNLNGKKFQGTFWAENEKDLRKQLAKQNLYLVSAKVTTDKSPNPFFSVTGKTSVSELSTFARQFSILIESGMPIVDCIGVLKTQSYTSYFRKVLEMVHESVKSGKLLSEAMAKHKHAFPPFFVSMVKVGELSGSLDKVLVSVAEYFESDAKIREKVKGALAYPVFLIIMAIALVALMTLFVIPTFMEAFESIDVEMPALTLALYDFSNFVMANWQYILLIVVLVVLLFILFLRTKQGRLLWDAFKFKCPFVRDVVRNTISARFSRAFSLLVDGGMDIADALDEVVIVIGNKYVEKQFKKAAEDVRHGMSLSVALNGYKLFPDMLVQMVSVGEKTGEIGKVLSRSSSFFEGEVEHSLTTLTGIIQPVILILIGVAVGLLFYAVYAPMISLMSQL